jgi:hypothetical protein
MMVAVRSSETLVYLNKTTWHYIPERLILMVLWGGGRGGHEFFLWGTFILNEIWAQDKIYILLGALLCWNMKLVLFYNLNITQVYINLQK